LGAIPVSLIIFLKPASHRFEPWKWPLMLALGVFYIFPDPANMGCFLHQAALICLKPDLD